MKNKRHHEKPPPPRLRRGLLREEEELRGGAYRPKIERRRWAATLPGALPGHAVAVPPAITSTREGAALLASLQSGHLAGAGLDVWDQEPPPLDHPLLAHDKVFATFHTAGVTHEARRNMARIAADQIAQVLAGERPPRLVNPEAWPAFEARRALLLA